MDQRTSRLRLITAVAAGVTAWEALVHASLLLNRSTPTLFGFRLIPRLNLVQTIVPATASVLLARYAFGGRERPPFAFRLIARRSLEDDLGTSVRRVLAAADVQYERLAPKVAMAATAPGRLELRTSAYLLALYRAMRDEGIGDVRATALLQRALFRVMRQVWRVPEAIAAATGARYPTDRRAKLQVRLARALVFRQPDWAMHEVPPDGVYGIDVTRCVVRDFFVSENAAELCDAVYCRQDVLMAEARGVPFTRTRTLARGDALCDFRFG